MSGTERQAQALAVPAAADAIEPLPVWDLTHLYPGRDSPELEADLAAAEAEAKSFQGRFQGRLGELDGTGLAAAIAAYERLDETLARILSYASLTYAGNMADPELARFYQGMEERVTAISSCSSRWSSTVSTTASSRPGSRRRRWRATGRGCATSASFGRTSSRRKPSACCSRSV